MVADRDVKAVLALHERLARIRADDRFSEDRNGGDTRALAEAIAWAGFQTRAMPAGDDRHAEFNRLICRWMGMGWSTIAHTVIRGDAPRFEPDGGRTMLSTLRCQVPKERGPNRGDPCGGSASRGGRETDPATGEWRVVYYCRKHEAYAKAAHIAEQQRQKAGGIPEPFPNRGGLLPCHTTVQNWPDLYAQAAYGWKPPSVGIRRDDWPVMARVVEAQPPRLALVAGGATGTDDTGPYVGPGTVTVGVADKPAPLRLVRGGDDD